MVPIVELIQQMGHLHSLFPELMSPHNSNLALLQTLKPLQLKQHVVGPNPTLFQPRQHCSISYHHGTDQNFSTF
uniref:Uncharacterized protein n=1 Tax=Arcella intermedia TaxID=1963864 RepID=A0A6B2LV02_9EUKA